MNVYLEIVVQKVSMAVQLQGVTFPAHQKFRPEKVLKKVLGTGKSLSEALLFAEHWENMLCTKIVLNVRNNFCTQHVLPRFELGIFMY